MNIREGLLANRVKDNIFSEISLRENISELKNTNDVSLITQAFCNMTKRVAQMGYVDYVAEYRKLVKIFAKKIDFNELITYIEYIGRNAHAIEKIIYEHILPIIEYEAELIHGPRYSALEHSLSSVLPPELIGRAYSMVDYREEYKGENRGNYLPKSTIRGSPSRRGGKSLQGRRSALSRRGSK